MLLIGSHVNFGSEQLLGCLNQALSYGANAFMFYTGAPQNTLRSAIKDDYLEEFQKLIKENNFDIHHIICHAPYIINLANNIDPIKYDFSIKFLKGEITRCQKMGIKFLVVHPGSAVSHERKDAINNIINALNFVIDETIELTILLETMAGKGTECGINIDELKTIVEGVNYQDKIGVCIDSCHLNDSGVDLNKFDEYLSEFDNKIGLNKIKCFHINDSKNEMGTHKDRHANLGYGTIGFDCLLKLIYHDKLKDVPKILETPYIDGKAPYKYEIKMIKEKIFNPNLEKDVINN